jgi:hypothetical protein
MGSALYSRLKYSADPLWFYGYLVPFDYFWLFTSATMSSEDPLLDGQPISQLKVVDLRRELDRFGLPKAGNKKDLFERLRDHLNGNDGGRQEAPTEANEAESASRPSTRSSASPRKSSPTKATTPAKSQSPTVSPIYVDCY